MSIEINYFFTSKNQLEELASEFSVLLGCRFQKNVGVVADLHAELLSLEVSLGYNLVDDDVGIDFSKYSHFIGIRTPMSDGDLRDIQLALMVSIAILLNRRSKFFNGMLVYENQHILADYAQKEMKNGTIGVYEMISGKYISLSDHVSDLSKRINKWQS